MVKTFALHGPLIVGVSLFLFAGWEAAALAEELPLKIGIRMAFQVPLKKASREGMESMIGGGADVGLFFRRHLDLSGGVEYVQGRNDNTYAVYDLQGNILDSGFLDESALSGLVSLRWRLEEKSTPYIGFGVGGSHLSWKVGGFKEGANAPLLEAFGGYEFATGDHFRLDLGLRLRSQKADVDWGGVPSDLTGIEFSVGSSYNW
jgi:opacity protein-like surface antigen